MKSKTTDDHNFKPCLAMYSYVEARRGTVERKLAGWVDVGIQAGHLFRKDHEKYSSKEDWYAEMEKRGCSTAVLQRYMAMAKHDRELRAAVKNGDVATHAEVNRFLGSPIRVAARRAEREGRALSTMDQARLKRKHVIIVRRDAMVDSIKVRHRTEQRAEVALVNKAAKMLTKLPMSEMPTKAADIDDLLRREALKQASVAQAV